jgi:hypothetical protein
MHVVYGGTADRKVTGSAMATDSRARVVHSIVSVVKISQLLSALLSDCGYASQLVSRLEASLPKSLPISNPAFLSKELDTIVR